MNSRSPIKYAAATLALGFGLAVAVPAAASANVVRPDPTAVEYAVGTASSAYGTWDYAVNAGTAHVNGTNWDDSYKQGQALMRPDPTAVEYAVNASAAHPNGSNWD